MTSFKDADLLEADEDLAVSSPQRRNWKGIVTALAVIMFICSMIGIAVMVLTPLDANGDGTRQPISLKDAIGSAILGHIEALEWMDGNKLLVRANDLVEVVDFSTDTWKNYTLFDTEALYRHGKVKSTNVIHNTPHVEITYFGEKNKDPTFETYTTKRIYDTRTGTFENVGPQKTGSESVDALKFNPDGAGYVFVHKFNLYYRPGFNSDELVNITTDGNTDYRHGITNWAYGEELFGPDVFWWSDDGQEVAYMTTDLNKVKSYNISYYMGQQYPLLQTQRYAKAGVRDLEKVDLKIWNKRSRKTVNLTVELPEHQKTYLMHASYATLHGQNVLIAVFSNRFQDEVSFTLCTAASGKCVLTYHQSYEIGEFHQYALPEHVAIAAHTNNSFFTILPHRRPNGDVFNQIARITVPSHFVHGKENFLAMGDQEVDSIDSYDAETETIYFTSPAPIHRQLHLYATSALPQNNQLHATCITCGVSANCTYHTTTFAPSSTKFFMNCKGIGPTTVYVAEVDANRTVKVLAEFGQTSERDEELIRKKFPTVHFENVTLANGFEVYTRMFLPHGVSLNSVGKRYPVLVYVYGGPNSHQVHEEWLPEMPVDVYFSSTLEYVIINIDGRGSGNAGWRRRQPMYGHLGTVEVDDQIEATKLLLKKHKFLDKKRVGMWGWSYGGFVTAHAIARDNDHVFKCAAMIAPVVNFKMYDAIYTERYMGNATQHAYDLTNVATNVTNFHFVRSLLIHGLADDNVHFQNTAELINAFVRENVQFELMVYPDEMHSLKGVRPHLFEMLIGFFKSCMDDVI
ncbi:unnamed protein product [Bursaphelenchus xylophilus]|uniref:(pine wood nematode) hypothetical protein n=1 Tax=Bursaphelenchus xylophilus TaxID=6326 RepID=A0A1I7RVG0_BURXY|nr:unnamed protein product [Bursaphelenchus xylophilus]CAG9086781.1 unnamed protein product [Bursaphelenchus xylophilus]